MQTQGSNRVYIYSNIYKLLIITIIIIIIITRDVSLFI